MKFKKIIYSISILLVIGSLQIQAGKKLPPLSLKELENPNSPSYVPYPYPKNDFEIVEDFKYAIKVHFGPGEGKRTSLVAGYPDYKKLMLNVLGDDPSLEVAQIIKVKDLVETSRARYYFLLEVVDRKGEVKAVGRVDEFGLMGGVAFISEKRKFKPFKNEQQVKNIFRDVLGNIEINEMERIALHSTICDPYAPLWKIITPMGNFYVDYRKDNVYSIEEEVHWIRENGYPDPERKRILILDSLNDRVVFLRKVEKKENL